MMQRHLGIILWALVVPFGSVYSGAARAQDLPPGVLDDYHAKTYDGVISRLDAYRKQHGPTVSADFLLGSSLCRMPGARQVQISRGIDLLEWMVSEWTAVEGYKVTAKDRGAVQSEVAYCSTLLPSFPTSASGGGLRPGSVTVLTGSSPGFTGIRFRPVDPSILMKAGDLSRALDRFKTTEELNKALEKLREGDKGSLIPKR